MQAGMERAAAITHPSSRGPTSVAGWATATGNTKVSSAAVDADAACGETIPPKSTPKATAAITVMAAASWVETTVPSVMKQLPTTKRAAYEVRRVRGRPGNSTSSNRAKEPKAPKRLTCGVREEQMGEPEHRGHHHGGADRPLAGQKIGVLCPEPPVRPRPSDAVRMSPRGGPGHGIRAGCSPCGGRGHVSEPHSTHETVPADPPGLPWAGWLHATAGWQLRDPHGDCPPMPTSWAGCYPRL